MDHYEVLAAIGQGQYGTAYKARHKIDGKLYCIKQIKMTAKDDLEGALREAQLLSSLNHVNVIGYKESFLNRDQALCIVTCFCEEGDLFRKIRQHHAAKQYFGEDEIMDMFIQISSALKHIHDKKVLHRDLKTQNIFIARGGIVKLGDFGISKILTTGEFASTVTGTPYYMAPEICTNQPYTFKSDIWSLGCVLYELCTLKHAFAADSLLSLVYQIVRGNYPPIPAERFSEGLSNLVNELLNRDTDQRPSLNQIFQMPYVASHMQRYQQQERCRILQQTSSLNRSRMAPSVRTMPQGFMPGGDSICMSIMDSDGGCMTPKERMRQRKLQQAEQRKIELRVASINVNSSRHEAGARKHHLIYGHGEEAQQGGRTLRGSMAATGPGVLDNNQGAWQDTGAYSSSRPAANPSDIGAYWPGPAAPSTYTQGLDSSTVNIGTMPSGARVSTAYDERPLPRPNQPSSASSAGSSAYDRYNERPLPRPGSQQPVAADDEYGGEESVLMGSVVPGSMFTTRGQRPALQSPAPSESVASFKHGLDPDQAASPKGGVGTSGGFNFGVPAGDASSSSAAGVGENGGFRFGVPLGEVSSSQQGMPAASYDVRPITPGGVIKFGISSGSRPRGSFDYIIHTQGQLQDSGDDDQPLPECAATIKAQYPLGTTAPASQQDSSWGCQTQQQQQQQQQQPGGSRLQHTTGNMWEMEPQQQEQEQQQWPAPAEEHYGDVGGDEDAYSDDFEDYQDDFECYSGEDDEEGSTIGAGDSSRDMRAQVKQRIQIVQNVRDMVNNHQPRGLQDSGGSIAAVQEHVPLQHRDGKLRVLHERCTATLGSYFGGVYDYLRQIRAATMGSYDEREVQRQLLELVGGERALVQGCFLVDQLVFQEMMMSPC